MVPCAGRPPPAHPRSRVGGRTGLLADQPTAASLYPFCAGSLHVGVSPSAQPDAAHSRARMPPLQARWCGHWLPPPVLMEPGLAAAGGGCGRCGLPGLSSAALCVAGGGRLQVARLAPACCALNICSGDPPSAGGGLTRSVTTPKRR